MSDESNELVHAKVVIDGRCVDLLLSEDSIVDGFKNAMNNPDDIPVDGQYCPCDKPEKCSLLDRILNRCCECDRG